MARNPSSSDGSPPAIGELIKETSGGRPPRRPRRGDPLAGLTADPTSSPEMRAHDDAARTAQAAHNSGASDEGGPVMDSGGLLGGGSRGSGNTWATLHRRG
jgi:hypothetical protein